MGQSSGAFSNPRCQTAMQLAGDIDSRKTSNQAILSILAFKDHFLQLADLVSSFSTAC